MPSVPAICESCGTVFASGFVIEGGARVLMSGSRSGPCPSCGGWGVIPDGLWSVAAGVVQVVRRAQPSADEIRRLMAELAALRAGRSTDRESVEDAIDRSAPSLTDLKAYLPRTPAEVLVYVGILLAALQVIIGMVQTAQQPSSDRDVITNVFVRLDGEEDDDSLDDDTDEAEDDQPGLSPGEPVPQQQAIPDEGEDG